MIPRIRVFSLQRDNEIGACIDRAIVIVVIPDCSFERDRFLSILRCFGHDIDDTAHGFCPIERTCRAFDHFDLFDHVRWNARK